MTEWVYVALGGNLGSVAETFARALAHLEVAGVRVAARSALYRTPAMVPEGAQPGPDYLNAAVRAHTALEPQELMALLLQSEQALGRTRLERWASRSIDLDLVAFGERRLHAPGLQLPHPAWHQRAFVVWPLADVHVGPPLPVQGGGMALPAELRGALVGDEPEAVGSL